MTAKVFIEMPPRHVEKTAIVNHSDAGLFRCKFFADKEPLARIAAGAERFM
jgi:hypothetical protein